MNVFTKLPDEIIPVSMDFINLVNNTENIILLAMKVKDLSNVDLTDSFISNYAIDGTECKAAIKSGTLGKHYKITFLASTDEGNVYGDVVHMLIAEY